MLAAILNNQFPVLARLARQVERRAADLHLTVGVGVGSELFGMGRGWQHHIGMPGGLGQEDVLHHQVFELGKGGPRMDLIGIGHGRVFAHDVHALDRVVMDGVDDLDHGQPLDRIERRDPRDPRIRRGCRRSSTER